MKRAFYNLIALWVMGWGSSFAIARDAKVNFTMQNLEPGQTDGSVSFSPNGGRFTGSCSGSVEETWSGITYYTPANCSGSYQTYASRVGARPGFRFDSFFMFRSLINDRQISVVNSGGNCPGSSQNYNFLIFRGKNSNDYIGAMDFSSASTWAGGSFNYNNSAITGVNRFSLEGLSAISQASDGYAYQTISSNCASASWNSKTSDFNDAPLGDFVSWLFGTNLAVSISDGSNPIMTVAVPQSTLSTSSSYWQGRNKSVYSGLMTYFTGRGQQSQKNVYLIPDSTGKVFSISEASGSGALNDTSKRTALGSLDCSTINSPANGFCSGTLSFVGNAQTGKVACLLSFDTQGKDLIFCSAQNPSSKAQLVTFAGGTSSQSQLQVTATPVHLNQNQSSGTLTVTVSNLTSRPVNSLDPDGLGDSVKLASPFTAISSSHLSGNLGAGGFISGSTCGTFIPAFSSCTLTVSYSPSNNRVDKQTFRLPYDKTTNNIVNATTSLYGSRGLSSLTVTAPAVTVGSNAQATVTATFADGSTQDVTSIVGFSSSNSSTLPVSSAGLVSAPSSTGSTTLTSSFGNVTASAVVTAYAAAPNPTSFTATAASSSQIDLSWASGGGSTSQFQIAYQTGATAPANCSTGTVITAATQGAAYTRSVTGLSASTQYSFRVCATNGAGTLTSGLTASATTPAAASADSSNVLLLSFNGTHGGTNFVDSSAFNHTVNNFGSAQHTTAFSFSGGASGSFNGSNNTFVKVPPSQSIKFGTADFSVEARAYPTQKNLTSDLASVVDTRPYGGGTGILIWLDTGTGKWVAYLSTNGNSIQRVIYSASVATLNAWTHLKIVRTGTAFQFYVNGVLQGTEILNSNWDLTRAGSAQVLVGTAADGPGIWRNFFGYIDDVKIDIQNCDAGQSNGVCIQSGICGWEDGCECGLYSSTNFGQYCNYISATAPAAPTNIVGYPGGTQVALKWKKPTNDGSSSITDYIVQYQAPGANAWTTFSDGTSPKPRATVTGLSAGTTYTFRVAAVNAIGTGAYEESSSYATDAWSQHSPTLLHSWSFANDYTDSVGDWHGSSWGTQFLSADTYKGFAGHFNYGGGDGYVSLGTQLLPSGAKTIAFWYKSNTVDNTIPFLLDLKSSDGDFFVYLDRSQATSHRISFAPRGWGATAESGHYHYTGDWTHVAVTYNGGSMASGADCTNNARVYINGKIQAIRACQGLNGGYTPENMFGKDSFAPGRTFGDYLDEVKIYQGVLSESAINELGSLDCEGTRSGTAVVDACGVCGGDNTSCSYTGVFGDKFYNNGVQYGTFANNTITINLNLPGPSSAMSYNAGNKNIVFGSNNSLTPYSVITTTGSVTFESDSYNYGTIHAESGSVAFKNSSRNWGSVYSTVSFEDNSYNQNAYIFGNTTFSGSSYNSGTVSAPTGTVTFGGYSRNKGTVTASTVTFNDSSLNGEGWCNTWDTTQIVNGDATFNHSSQNVGVVNGNASFYGSSQQNCTVNYVCTLNESSWAGSGSCGSVTDNR